jgi:hypothetical protein
MSSLLKKSMYISNYNIDKSLFDGSWKLSKIDNGLLILHSSVSLFKKQVSFSKNIEVNILHSQIHKSAQMCDYGNAPTKLKQLYEYYLINIMRHGDIAVSKFEFINNLLTHGLYTLFITEFINTYISLLRHGRVMLYTQHTYITKAGIDILTTFITKKTNIHIYTNRIHRFFRDYCVKKVL